MERKHERKEILEKLMWMARVRAIAGIVVLTLFGGMWVTGIMRFPFLLFSIAPFSIIFVNQPYPFIVRKVNDLTNLFFVSQIIDIVLITWGIYFLGGMNMITGILVYPLVFMFTGIVLGGKRTYLIANLSFLFYAAMVYLETQGIMPSMSTIDVKIAGEARFVLTLTICPFFNLIAFYAAYLSNMIVKKEKALREIQEKLKRSEKLSILGKSAGIIAHELRTPLGVMKNAIYYLRMKLKDIETEEKVKDILSVMDKEINASEKIIKDTLSFVKPMEVKKTKESINDIIKEAIEDIGFDQRIVIKLELDESLPATLVDKAQIRRAFNNILLNAGQAIKEEGKILIKSCFRSRYIEVSIFDTGIGILEENVKKVFEPLFSTKTVGTGFGLSVSQSIIKMHGGNMGVTSCFGKGATFTIKLPVV